MSDFPIVCQVTRTWFVFLMVFSGFVGFAIGFVLALFTIGTDETNLHKSYDE